MQVRHDVPLAPLTTLRVGGPAERLVIVDTADELVETVAKADQVGEPVLVLGGGSNVVLPDEGVAGTVVLVRARGVRLDGERLVVAAGEPWDELVARTVDAGLVGVECLAGIPGLAGATPIQNVGAYGQDVAQTVSRVRAYDRQDGDLVDLAAADCGFAYRSSRFKREPGRWVVVEVEFALRSAAHDDAGRPLGAPVRYPELARALGVAVGEQAPLRQVREAVLALRRGKGMVLDPQDHDTWSVGSFFTNPLLDRASYESLRERVGGDVPCFPDADGQVKVPAAWLIAVAGFAKGHGGGPARISTKHTLALTNRGAARATDVLALAREIRDAVRERLGVELVNEPVLVGAPL